MELKICDKCGSDKTYISKKGQEFWYKNINGTYICMKCYKLIYKKQHKDEIKEYNNKYSKIYYRKNKPKTQKNNKKWYEEHKEIHHKQSKKWHKDHPDRAKQIQNKANRKIRATIKGKIDGRMGAMLWYSLRSNKNGRKWESLVGYTAEDLKIHLESLFTEGMTWEKFMNGEIHIDHKKPRCLFNYESVDDPQFKECWSLSNLQPLWAIDNFKKGKKYNQK